MRIALCLSGQPRTWRRTRESLTAFFAGHDVDVFLHSWAEEDPAELQAVIDAYRPRAHAITERPLFVAEKRLLAERFPTRPPLTLFDMFHSIAESLALVEPVAGDYDLVVRARFDAMFEGAWSGEAPAPGQVIVPDLYPDASGCNDQFAIGDATAMRAYARAGAWFAETLPGLVSVDGWLRPEAVLLHYLRTVAGLAVELRPIAMRLCRPDQAHLPFAQLGDDPLFQAAKHEDWQAFAQAHFPEVADEADFNHPARQPLALDRALSAWVEANGEDAAQALFAAPWPQRIQAIDAMLDRQTGGLRTLDDDSYQAVRVICAALLQRMEFDPALCPSSAAVHLLSDNFRDMRRVDAWTRAQPGALALAMTAAPAGGLLATALGYKPPLSHHGHDIWRRRA